MTVIATLPRHSKKKSKLPVYFAQHTFTSCATWGLPEGEKMLLHKTTMVLQKSSELMSGGEKHT
jgi:hypothetical protein